MVLLYIIGILVGIRRHGTAEANQHRYDGTAGKSKLSERLIHDKGNTCHIAGIFQQGKEEEQNHDIGDKAKHRTDAVEYAVDDHRMQAGRRAPSGHGRITYCRQMINTAADQIFQERTEYIEGQIEDRCHDGNEAGDRGIFARQHLIDLL